MKCSTLTIQKACVTVLKVSQQITIALSITGDMGINIFLEAMKDARSDKETI